MLWTAEAGAGQMMALMDPAQLDAVVITHWHNDHAADLLALRYYLLIHKKAVSLCAAG